MENKVNDRNISTVQDYRIPIVIGYSCPKCGCKELLGIPDIATSDKQSIFYEKITDHLVKCKKCGYTAKGEYFHI